MSNVVYINEEVKEIIEDLPRSYTTRWNASRKAAVVRAVQTGVIGFDKARALYRLSRSEFDSWARTLAEDGLDGLSAGELIARSARRHLGGGPDHSRPPFQTTRPTSSTSPRDTSIGG
jgi:hypothetical protein